MDNSLINRQAAIDVARKCPVKEVTPAYMLIDKAEAMRELMMLPSAESEIIRCKDCKYAHLTYSGDCKFCDKWTDEFGIPEEVYLDGAFFCGYAKRREDE